LALPRADPEIFAGYLTEEQAGDYPEGRYELGLQTAVEAGSQLELDALFARRSGSQMVRLCFILIVVMSLLLLAMKLLTSTPAPPATTPRAAEGPVLPAAEECRSLTPREWEDLTQKLRALAVQVGVSDVKRYKAEGLVTAIDERLGTPPNRDCGPLRDIKPLERRLRALLWKHDVPGYNEMKYNPIELVERLQEKLARGKRGW
jgi:hypothetical protein